MDLSDVWINRKKKKSISKLDENHKKLIENIYEFNDILAHEIMTPRTDVLLIDLEDERDEYLDELMELTHSRIPVCEGDADNIIGILHIKDYLHAAAKGSFDDVDIKSLLRPAYFVPETKNIESLLFELQKEKQHLAILIDEFGGFSGIVSVEDIVEQIIGDIDDEFDEEDRVIEVVDERTFIVDGNVYLDDLEDETGIKLESETSETIGGFIIDLTGEIPKEKKTYSPIFFENYQFDIISVKDRRIEQAKITILDTQDFDED